MAHYLPSLVVPPIVARLRHETQNVILPGEEEDLRRYLEERRRAGMRLNLNQLGEAILGEAEAARRLEAYLALLARDDVEYISVKVSSVFSQIDLVAFRATVARVAERLRTLYRAAARHRYRHPDGRVTPKFINLDMEEYRDLDLTVTAFREVLDEPEFLPLSAGIVLQAYLPDSHRVQRALTEWARARRARGGAPIKLRIVKGANLAMERIEAAVHGWPQAPVRDARPRWTPTTSACSSTAAGPSTPRPCTWAWPATTSSTSPTASCCARRHGVERWVEFEMLEGMANHQARAVRERAGGLLLYAPVVRAEDFHSAIAYLVRRLDENTAPENFLRHVFDLEPGSPDVDRRARSLPGRVRARRPGSPTRPAARRTGAGKRRPRRRAVHRARGSRTIPTPTGRSPPTAPGSTTSWPSLARALAGRDPARRSAASSSGRAAAGEKRDPSRPERVAYRYRAGRPRGRRSRADRRAGGAAGVGGAARRDARRRRLEACAAELGRRRGDLIGAMIARRRQDRDGGGRRGLRSGRLRALLRPHAARDAPTSSTIAAWSRSAWWS